MSFVAIHAALDGQLDEISAAWTISWENVPFNPEKELWIRPTFSPSDAMVVELGEGAKQRKTGIYQVSVFSPEGVGTKPARDAVAEIEEAFSPGTRVDAGEFTVTIERVVAVEAIPEPGWYQVPVLVYWRAYT